MEILSKFIMVYHDGDKDKLLIEKVMMMMSDKPTGSKVYLWDVIKCDGNTSIARRGGGGLWSSGLTNLLNIALRSSDDGWFIDSDSDDNGWRDSDDDDDDDE